MLRRKRGQSSRDYVAVHTLITYMIVYLLNRLLIWSSLKFNHNHLYSATYMGQMHLNFAQGTPHNTDIAIVVILEVSASTKSNHTCLL